MTRPSRREFLRHLGVGTATVIGGGYARSTWPMAEPTGASTRRAGALALDPSPESKGRTLVIVEMGGGNDSLNTIVPLNDGRYHDLRPTLAITDPIDLDGEVGLHPNLPNLAERYRNGHVAIVDGLGYDDADLSHFGSFAIWWTAKGGAGGGVGGGAGGGVGGGAGGGAEGGGWLGAYLDATVGFDDPLAAIGIGPGPSPALIGRQSFATTISDRGGLQPRLPDWLDGPDQDADDLIAAWSDFTPADASGSGRLDATTLVGQVQRAVGLTVKARMKLTKALGPEGDGIRDRDDPASAAARARYQDASVVDSLRLAAELVQSPARPRIIYVSGIGDFDTHEGQAERHAALLADLDAGIQSFFDALGDAASTALVMTVSEFGRRPAENGSGTDHGTANAHFVIGPGVKGGRYGEPSSLASLDRNDNLVHTNDFRRHYATGLRWLGVDDSTPVLGEEFKAFSIFKDS
jgi:uncharacterized protein (DUF1501 family)